MVEGLQSESARPLKEGCAAALEHVCHAENATVCHTKGRQMQP
jgi:hypothetical protein